jgi:hypothetical protein
MNFALLWIDALAVSLLWCATLAACACRIRSRWVKWILLLVVIGVPLFPLGTFALAAMRMKFVMRIQPDWFGYALSLLLAYLIGASLILWQGRREPGLTPAAANWRRGPLALSFAIAIGVGYATLLNMDFALRARCAVVSVEVNSIYLATLPAITSDSQNAAPLYEEAFDRLKQDQDLEVQVQNPPTGNGENFDPAEPATIAFLKHEAKTIARIRRAAALPACRFDEDLSQPDIAVMLKHLNDSRNLANVVGLDAREAIAHGDAATAISDAAAIFGMSRHFGERPTLVAALVGMGIDGLGVKTLGLALPAVKSQDELASLHLEELPTVERVVQQALRGEERWGLLLLDNMPPSAIVPVNGKMPQEEGLLSARAGPASAFLRVFFLDSDAYMDLMQALQSASAKPYFQSRTEWDPVKNQQRGRGLFTAILLPSFTRVLETCGRAEANEACAQAAVAMTRFRLDHGAFPSHLDDLVPRYLDAVPIDPFDGNPLRLAVKGDKWIVYSVGPDVVDKGGAEMLQAKGDVTFTLSMPAAKATTAP